MVILTFCSLVPYASGLITSCLRNDVLSPDAASQFKHYPGTYHGFAIRGDKRGKDTRDATIRESQAEVRLCGPLRIALVSSPRWPCGSAYVIVPCLHDLPMHCSGVGDQCVLLSCVVGNA